MSQSTLIDLSAVRVLCVDDDPVMRSVIRSALQRRGCRDVVQANGGVDALDLCAGRTFDLVICDFHMSPMTGLDFLRALAVSGLGEGWPVIMLSADTNPDIIRDAQDLGVSAWVGKPVSVHTLIEKVSAVLRGAGQISVDSKDGEMSAMAERHHATLMAALTASEDSIQGLSFRGRDVMSLTQGLRHLLDNVASNARMLGYGLVTMLAERAMDLIAAMLKNPPAAMRCHADAARALAALTTTMKRIAKNRMEGDGGEGGLKLLDKIDRIVSPVRTALG